VLDRVPIVALLAAARVRDPVAALPSRLDLAVRAAPVAGDPTSGVVSLLALPSSHASQVDVTIPSPHTALPGSQSVVTLA
jgi:hypothetical protein